MNGTSSTFDALYVKGRQGKYPNEMLIRFINSKFPPEVRANSKILDLGFGTGRHLIYLAEEGFQAHGIERSINGVEIAANWLSEKGLKAVIKAGSVVDASLGKEEFDAIIDVACIQHNRYAEMERIVLNSYCALKQGGYLFSVQKNNYDSLLETGTQLEGMTYEFPEGVDKVYNSTIISFASIEDITKLYGNFSNVQIEKEEWTFNNMKKTVSHWIVTAQK